MSFLLGFSLNSGNQGLEKILWKGMKNVQQKLKKPDRKVTPVTLDILEKIKNGLDSEICSSCSKKSIWALSLSAFWGLLRLGEVLPAHGESFDKTTTLLWKDVEFFEDKVIFHLKSTKTNTKISKEVVLYKLSNSLFCPVTNLKKLQTSFQKKGLWGRELPVFLRSSGKSLTKLVFIKALNTALKAVAKNPVILQGKSFRSGIPSTLDKSLEETEKKVLKTLGRWIGPSYHCYIRNPVPENRWIYHKVSDFLLNDFFYRKEEASSDSSSGEQ